MRWLILFFMTGCISEVVPKSNACHAWADAVTQRGEECGLILSRDLNEACEGRLITNDSEIWDKCIPEVEATTCADLPKENYCHPLGIKL